MILLTTIQSQNNIEKPTNTGAINISATNRTRKALHTITDGVDEFSIIPAHFYFFLKYHKGILYGIFIYLYGLTVCYLSHMYKI